MINWLKLEGKLFRGESDPGLLVYLKPEALEHAMVVEDFEAFQSSPDFVPGGRLLDVRRQYSYTLRQVADLVEEPVSPPAAEKPSRSKAKTQEVQEEKPAMEDLEALLVR
jgi:hypothetical protein